MASNAALQPGKDVAVAGPPTIDASATPNLDDADGIDWDWLAGARVLGVTAGASAPETLVEGLIAAIGERFALTVEEVSPVRETVAFKLPRALAG